MNAKQKKVLIRVGEVVILLIAVLSGVSLWQNHENTLAYRLRNCHEVSDNSGYIGFQCPSHGNADPGQTVYVPYSERQQVVNLLASNDEGQNSF